MFPQVTRPMGSWMCHVWNLDLSDLFLNIYHFYAKALLSIGNWITYALLNLMAKAINYRVPNHKEYIWFPIFEMKNIGHFLIIQESKIHLIPFTLDRILHYIIHFYNHKKITFTKFFAIALIDEQNLILAFLNFSKNHQIHVKFFDCKNGKKKNVGSILNMKYECIWWAYWICICYVLHPFTTYLIKTSNLFVTKYWA